MTRRMPGIRNVTVAMKRHEVREPIYNSRVLLLSGGTHAEAADVAKKWFAKRGVECMEKDDSADDRADGRVFHGDMRHFVLWVADAQNTGDVTHEVIHLAVAVITGAGLKIKRSTDEPLAYFAGWLGGAWDQFRKHV